MLKNSMLYPRVTATRRLMDMDGMWKFQFDPDGSGSGEGWENGLPDPVLIPVPASFSDFFTDRESREYTGDFWYETEVVVPEEWAGMEIDVRFGCATHRATVFVNGTEIVFHEGGFLPFCARITNVVRYNRPNRVTVRVNNELSEYMLPAGRTFTLADGRKISKPYFDFFNYSGLQRPVKLIATPRESVFDFSVRHTLEGADAKVAYSVTTTGGKAVTVSVYDEAGKQVAQATGKEGTVTVHNVRLWQVLDAYLYKFVIRITDGDGILDEYYDEIGIRTVEVRDVSILVNGSPVYLKGFGKHEDSDISGRGFNMAVIKRDFECMKWVRANSFRTSHYPYSEEIYQMADREGFMVIDEVPAVGFKEDLMIVKDLNKDEQAVHYFDKPTTPQLMENHLEAVEEMIARDKNHACVIMWSLLNEPDTLTDSAADYFRVLFRWARELDVQKRPRTFAAVLHSQPESCKCHQFCDVIALNRYYGWYLYGGNELCTAEALFHDEMNRWKAKSSGKPVIFTEYGADTMPSEHKLPSVMWSQEYQCEYLDMCHRVFDAYDFIKGEQVWNFADFQTTEGILRVNGNKKGVFTRQRQPKDSAFYLKKRWEGLPLSYKSR
jgi:beta-glucuronidase